MRMITCEISFSSMNCCSWRGMEVYFSELVQLIVQCEVWCSKLCCSSCFRSFLLMYRPFTSIEEVSDRRRLNCGCLPSLIWVSSVKVRLFEISKKKFCYFLLFWKIWVWIKWKATWSFVSSWFWLLWELVGEFPKSGILVFCDWGLEEMGVSVLVFSSRLSLP